MAKKPGHAGKEIGDANLERVRTWFRHHLCGTQRECCQDLKLSQMAVNRHVKTLREEWRKFRKEGRKGK